MLPITSCSDRNCPLRGSQGQSNNMDVDMSVKTVAASPISNPGLTGISRSSTTRKGWCYGTKRSTGRVKKNNTVGYRRTTTGCLNGISMRWKGMRNI